MTQLSTDKGGHLKSPSPKPNLAEAKGSPDGLLDPLSVGLCLSIAHVSHSSLFPLGMPGPLWVAAHNPKMRNTVGKSPDLLSADTSGRVYGHLRTSVWWLPLVMPLCRGASQSINWTEDKTQNEATSRLQIGRFWWGDIAVTLVAFGKEKKMRNKTAQCKYSESSQWLYTKCR